MGLLDSLRNPHIIHAAAVHFPIALGIIGVLLVFLCAINQMKNNTLRWTVFACYFLTALFAFGTIFTGEAALDAVKAPLPAAAQSVVDSHRSLAENAWIPAAITAVFVLFCGVKSERVRTGCTMLAVLSSVVAGVWIGITAQYGAALSYEHGIGIAQRAVPSPPAPQPPAPPMQPPNVVPQPPPALGTPPVPPAQPANLAPKLPPALGTPPPPGQPPAVPGPAVAPPNRPPGLPQKPVTPPASTTPSYTTRMQTFFRDIKRMVWQ